MRRFGLLPVLCLAAAPVDGAELAGSVQVSGRPAQHAVVWLAANGVPAAPPQKVVIDQRNLAFTPRVLAVRVGTTVEFPNNDKVFHNVFSFRDGKKFDLGMYPKGVTKPIVFDKPGLARLFCNIHPNMAAYVMAVDSPYFRVGRERQVYDRRRSARHVHLSRVASGRSGIDRVHHRRWGQLPRNPVAMTIRALLGFVVVACTAVPALAQGTIAAEIDFMAGYSGEDVRATASQFRLFGKAPGEVDFFAEAVWADRWAGEAPVIGESLSGADPMGTDAYPARRIPTGGARC